MSFRYGHLSDVSKILQIFKNMHGYLFFYNKGILHHTNRFPAISIPWLKQRATVQPKTSLCNDNNNKSPSLCVSQKCLPLDGN